MFKNSVECISPHFGLSSPSIDTSYSYDGSSDEEIFSYDHDDFFCKPRNKYFLEDTYNICSNNTISFEILTKRLGSLNTCIDSAYVVLGLMSKRLKFSIGNMDTLNFIIYNYYFSDMFRNLQERYQTKVYLKLVQENVITFIFQVDRITDYFDQLKCDIYQQLNKIIDKELKFQKIISKLNYTNYPFICDIIDHTFYSNSNKAMWFYNNEKKIKLFHKLNNLSLVKFPMVDRNSIGMNISSYINMYEKNPLHNQVSFPRNVKYVIRPTAELIDFFTKEIRKNYDITYDRFNLEDFQNEVNPKLIFFVSDKLKRIDLYNINNFQVIYSFKIPKKYMQYKITNGCILENSNIKLELNYSYLLEIDMKNSTYKMFLGESTNNIMNKKVENIKLILNSNMTNSEIIETIRKIVN